MKIGLKNLVCVLFIGFLSVANAQTATVQGTVISNGNPEEFISIYLIGLDVDREISTDSKGSFQIDNLPSGEYTLFIEEFGFKNYTKTIILKEDQNLNIEINLFPSEESTNLGEVVISGTMKPVRRLDSPVPVEVYSPSFFRKNPTPSIFDAMSGINGVRPQVNCNVCDTGDIHINGLEGPYTMILIDGMPIVSSLGTVYGLSGIPNSLVERIEIVKGPASSLYGSEAVGGLINVITKNPQNAPLFSADVFSTTWGEYNTDLGY